MGRTSFPKMGYVVSWPVSGGRDVVLEAIRTRVREWMVGDEIAEMKSAGPDELIRKCAVDFSKEAEDARKEFPDSATVAAYEMRVKITPVADYAGTLTIMKDTWSYTGGAHGYGWTSYCVIDGTTGEYLSLGDMVDLSRAGELTGMIKDELRRISGMKKNDTFDQNGFFEENIKPSMDAYISNKGLVLHYNVYEIACYANGEYDVIFPYKVLHAKSLLKPEFARRIGLSR
jgi:hypothetical protein